MCIKTFLKTIDMTADKTTTIRGYAKRLRLSGLTLNVQDILLKAQQESPSYDDFLSHILEMEIKGREERQKLLRLKAAKLPLVHNLDLYDRSISNGLSTTQLNQLRELHWIDESYNLMLTGPCGVGKTFIAAGLCADAIDKGYKAYFRSMDEILTTLKLKDIVASAKKDYKNITTADVIVIDDLMNIPVSRDDGSLLFVFINSIYESTSLIITTNKSPAEWARSLDDEVLATALLDRILYKCELLQLSGNSYRMTNRKTIFKDEQEKENGQKTKI
jgi:DNA replication protein DnaC